MHGEEGIRPSAAVAEEKRSALDPVVIIGGGGRKHSRLSKQHTIKRLLLQGHLQWLLTQLRQHLAIKPLILGRVNHITCLCHHRYLAPHQDRILDRQEARCLLEQRQVALPSMQTTAEEEEQSGLRLDWHEREGHKILLISPDEVFE